MRRLWIAGRWRYLTSHKTAPRIQARHTRASHWAADARYLTIKNPTIASMTLTGFDHCSSSLDFHHLCRANLQACTPSPDLPSLLVFSVVHQLNSYHMRYPSGPYGIFLPSASCFPQLFHFSGWKIEKIEASIDWCYGFVPLPIILIVHHHG